MQSDTRPFEVAAPFCQTASTAPARGFRPRVFQVSSPGFHGSVRAQGCLPPRSTGIYGTQKCTRVLLCTSWALAQKLKISLFFRLRPATRTHRTLRIPYSPCCCPHCLFPAKISPRKHRHQKVIRICAPCRNESKSTFWSKWSVSPPLRSMFGSLLYRGKQPRVRFSRSKVGFRGHSLVSFVPLSRHLLVRWYSTVLASCLVLLFTLVVASLVVVHKVKVYYEYVSTREWRRSALTRAVRRGRGRLRGWPRGRPSRPRRRPRRRRPSRRGAPTTRLRRRRSCRTRRHRSQTRSRESGWPSSRERTLPATSSTCPWRLFRG